MRVETLRLLVRRFGPVGVLIVGGYLAFRQAPRSRQRMVIAGSLLLAVIMLSIAFSTIVSFTALHRQRPVVVHLATVTIGGHTLYVGATAEIKRKPAILLEQRLLAHWPVEIRTREVEQIAHDFSQAIDAADEHTAIDVEHHLRFLLYKYDSLHPGCAVTAFACESRGYHRPDPSGRRASRLHLRLSLA